MALYILPAVKAIPTINAGTKPIVISQSHLLEHWLRIQWELPKERLRPAWSTGTNAALLSINTCSIVLYAY